MSYKYIIFKKSLIVNLHFWNKDSNSLFDYEADEYIKSTLKVKKAGIMLRKDKQLQFLDKNKLCENGISSFVAKCEKKNDLFEMDFDEENDKYLPKNIEEKPWIIIRHTSFSNKYGYRLKVGNIIRFGKSIFKITELKSKDKRLKKEKLTITDLNKEDHQVADYTDNNVYPVNEFCSNNVDFIQVNRYDNKKDKNDKILTSENR